MIDPMSTCATDFEKSKAFYDAVLEHLGASLQMERVASWDEELPERPIYHPDYYGGFLLDPDGNNAEAVCHAPPAG